MNPAPKGKIGRLPMPLREAVNRRLENGEKGVLLVAWLNSLPEVQAVMAVEFNGQPISPQNLSQWRQHGFKDWLRHRQAQAMAAELGELPVAPDSPVGGQMAAWASVRYLMTVRELVENNAQSQSHLKVLRQFLRDIIALRRGEHRSARLKMQLERLERLANEHFPRKPNLADFINPSNPMTKTPEAFPPSAPLGERAGVRGNLSHPV